MDASFRNLYLFSAVGLVFLLFLFLFRRLVLFGRLGRFVLTLTGLLDLRRFWAAVLLSLRVGVALRVRIVLRTGIALLDLRRLWAAVLLSLDVGVALRIRIALSIGIALFYLRLPLASVLLPLCVRVVLRVRIVLLFLNLLRFGLWSLLVLIRTRILGLLRFLFDLRIRTASIVRTRSRRSIVVGPGIALIRRAVTLVRWNIV